MRWYCTDCSRIPKRARRAHCLLCCGFNTPEAIAAKRRTVRRKAVVVGVGELLTTELRRAAA